MAINIDAINSELQNASRRINTTQMIESLDAARTQLASVQIPDMGRVAGEVRGGFQSLTQDVDNPTEALQRAVDRPTITRITEEAASLLPSLKSEISSGDLSNIESVLNSSLSTGPNAVETIFPQAQSTLENTSAQPFDIVSNGSVQGIAAALQTATGATIPELESVLNQVAPPINQLQGDITQVLQKVNVGEVTSNLLGATQAMQGQISSLFGGNLTNNLLSDITNNLAGINIQLIQDVVPGLSDSVVSNISNAIRSNNLILAQNLLFRQVAIPQDIVTDLTAKGIAIPKVGNQEQALATMAFLNNQYPPGSSLAGSVAQLGGTYDSIIETISTVQTSLSRIIDTSSTQNVPPPSVTVRNYSGGIPDNNTTNQSATVAPTTPPVNNQGTQVNADGAPIQTTTNSEVSNNFTIIATQQEIQTYLISGSREFSTLIVDWSSTFTDQPLTASELNDYYLSNNRNGIPWHFIIRRDGTIETGVPLNTEGRYAGPFNPNSIGIAFVAGYNCSSDRNRYRDGVDPSLLSRRSITTSQMLAMHKFLKAFYAAIPAGEVYGQNNLYPRERARVAPGFDITNFIESGPYYKTNVGTPEANGRCLTLAEIRTARAERARGLANEVTDQN